jgi:hypothetical protein
MFHVYFCFPPELREMVAASPPLKDGGLCAERDCLFQRPKKPKSVPNDYT